MCVLKEAKFVRIPRIRERKIFNYTVFIISYQKILSFVRRMLLKIRIIRMWSIFFYNLIPLKTNPPLSSIFILGRVLPFNT